MLFRGGEAGWELDRGCRKSRQKGRPPAITAFVAMSWEEVRSNTAHNFCRNQLSKTRSRFDTRFSAAPTITWQWPLDIALNCAGANNLGSQICLTGTSGLVSRWSLSRVPDCPSRGCKQKLQRRLSPISAIPLPPTEPLIHRHGQSWHKEESCPVLFDTIG